MNKAKKNSKRILKKVEYDSAWKDIMEKHFESFLEFFFEDIHRDIDFSRGYEFLSQELRKITYGNKVGNRLADVLVKVYLKDGTQKYICIFIHIEVQGTKQPGFMVRIYIYNYRIFDKHKDKDVEVISLAVLTDEDENYRPDEYCVKRWGFEQKLKIPIVKIIDYKTKKELIEKLERSSNPMAMVVKAQLRSYETKRSDDEKKFSIKRDLIRQCLERGYTRKQIDSLIKFIDWIITLPEGLENRLSEEISKLEEDHNMTYVTSWERIAEKRGRKEGKREGKKEGKWDVVKNSLEEGLPIRTIERITGFPAEKIHRFKEKLVHAN